MFIKCPLFRGLMLSQMLVIDLRFLHITRDEDATPIIAMRQGCINRRIRLLKHQTMIVVELLLPRGARVSS